MLYLEIATDNGAPKNILTQHQEVIKMTRWQIEVLKAEGKDPKAVFTKAYRFDFSPFIYSHECRQEKIPTACLGFIC